MCLQYFVYPCCFGRILPRPFSKVRISASTVCHFLSAECYWLNSRYLEKNCFHRIHLSANISIIVCQFYLNMQSRAKNFSWIFQRLRISETNCTTAENLKPFHSMQVVPSRAETVAFARTNRQVAGEKCMFNEATATAVKIRTTPAKTFFHLR